MEQRFGRDFSRVQVHSGAAAEQSVRDINAHAYTVGRDIVFGAGHFSSGTHAARHLLAHELTHVVQQSGGGAPSPGAVQRKVILNGAEMSAKDRKTFLRTHKWTNQGLASTVMDDMAAAADSFDFKDEAELESEIHKRLSTVGHMEESQRTTEKIPGDKRAAFGYPFTGASLLYGPRVNYASARVLGACRLRWLCHSQGQSQKRSDQGKAAS